MGRSAIENPEDFEDLVLHMHLLLLRDGQSLLPGAVTTLHALILLLLLF